MRVLKLTYSLCIMLAASQAFAAVTVENLSKAKFSGNARMVNVFAGKAAKDGVVVKSAIDGDRSATQTDRNVEVIDLAAEKIWSYKFSRRGKPGRCSVTTFDERREAMAALADLDLGKAQRDAEASADAAQAPEFEVSATVTDTGNEETHAGMTGKAYQIEILVHRPDMTIEQGGGARINTTVVIGPKPEGWQESIDWTRRFLEAMNVDMDQLEGLGKLLASMPMLSKAMAEFREKQDELDGAVLRSEMRIFTAADPRAAEQAQSEEDDDVPTSLGGLGAKIGGSLLKRKRDEAAAKGPAEVFMSSTVLQSYSAERDDILTLPERCEQ